MQHYSQSIKIRFVRELLFEQYLWSHVSWCAAGLFLGADMSLKQDIFGDTKIRDPCIAILLKDNIFRLEIFVDNVHLMYVFQANDDAGDYKLLINPHLLISFSEKFYL